MNPLKYNPNKYINQPTNPLEDIQNELRINSAYHKIMTTPMQSEQRTLELSNLLRERASLLHHVPVNGLKGSVIFFNMNQIGLAPTPICPTYNKMRVPTISNYHLIGSNIGVVLLNKHALQHVPKEILEKAGDISGKQMEFIWTAIDGRPFVNMDRSINLCTHPWSHPHALFNDDVKYDVNMGIFSEIGFKSHDKPGSVAYHRISPMQVHTHFGNGSMLFSPDNAHFEILPNSPFGIFWSVTQKDQRIAFSKNLVIFDYEHPICRTLLASIRNCNDLGTHLERLEQTENAIKKSLTLPDYDFMNAFHTLPPAFQYGIYKEAWILFNSPTGVHRDFGKASFENEKSLDTKFHSSHEQRKEAVNRFAARLEDLLIHSQMNLMLHCQPLQKGNNILKMLECAQLFIEKKEPNAMDLFNLFSPEEKEAVYFAIWELSRCPRGNMMFGKETFLSPKTPLNLKSESLVLAASRQTPKFDEILVAALPPAEMDQKEEIPIPLTPEIPNTPPYEPSLPIYLETPPPSAGISPQDVLEAMMNLAFDGNFHKLTPAERKKPIMELFNHLPVETKNSIYGKIYEYSTDTKKGGHGWGEAHVADDLEVLIFALQSILE